MIDMTRLLAPPPNDAEALAGELEFVRKALATRLPARMACTEADTAVSVFRFDDVLGALFTAGNLPQTEGFFAQVYHHMGTFLLLTKECWRRPRPFELDKGIVPPDSLLASAVDCSGATTTVPSVAETPHTSADPGAVRYSYAYPSGHAAFGALAAILLADMVPEQREALFRRGWEYGEARIIGGLHFPSDVEAGRVMATVLVASLLQDLSFQTDLSAARIELRTALGL